MRKVIIPLLIIMLIFVLFMPMQALAGPQDQSGPQISPVLYQAEDLIPAPAADLPNVEDVGVKAFAKAIFTWKNTLTAMICLLGLIATAKFIGIRNSLRDLLIEIKESIDPESEAGKKISPAEATRIVKRVFAVIKEILLQVWNPFKFRLFKRKT